MHVFFWSLAFCSLFLTGLVGILTGVGHFPPIPGCIGTLLSMTVMFVSAWIADRTM